MSDFKVNSITDRSGINGPVFAGVSTNASSGCMIIPKGNTGYRTIPESVATDGLVGYYDAGNTASYSGSGTTWFDLSDNANHGTISGATFNSSNGGYFTFDGTNDLVTVPYQQNFMRVNQVSNHTQLTYDLFMKFAAGTGGNFMGVSVNGGHGSGGLFYGNNSASPHHNLSDKDFSNRTFTLIYTPTDPESDTNYGAHFNTDPDDLWVHVVVSWDFFTASGTFYHNGEVMKGQFQNKTTTNGLPKVSYNQNQVDNLAGGRYVNSQNYEAYDVAIIKLYNRALSEEEVKGNFNAHRGRFGI